MLKSKDADGRRYNDHRPSICACANVRRGARAITKLYDMTMEPCGLKVTQFSILINIMAAGPLNVTELAKILKLDRTTLVRNLKILRNGGLVESGTGTDARMRTITVTPKGKNRVEAAIPYWEKAQTALKNRLGAGSLEKLVNLLMDIESFAG